MYGISQKWAIDHNDFETMGEVIFRGQATVENGVFKIKFYSSKDISIPVGMEKSVHILKQKTH